MKGTTKATKFSEIAQTENKDTKKGENLKKNPENSRCNYPN